MKRQLNKKSWFTALANSNHLDLYLYGKIGGWDVDVESFRRAMQGYESVTTITVYLSTTGGYFEDGIPIFNMIKQHPAEVTVLVMGFALSMGSVIMLAGDKVKAAQNSMIMIHRAQGWASGDAEEFRKQADIAEVHERAIIPLYMSRLNISADAVLELLKAETWYTADDALTAGLIDEIIDPIDTKSIEDAVPMANIKEAMKSFKHPPAQLSATLDSDDNKSLLLKILNAVVGEKPPALILEPKLDDSDMTEEQLKALFAQNNKEVLEGIDAKLALFKSAPEDKPEETLETKFAALAILVGEQGKTIKAQASELAHLKAKAPSTKHEDNTGGNGDDEDTEGYA